MPDGSRFLTWGHQEKPDIPDRLPTRLALSRSVVVSAGVSTLEGLHWTIFCRPQLQSQLYSLLQCFCYLMNRYRLRESCQIASYSSRAFVSPAAKHVKYWTIEIRNSGLLPHISAYKRPKPKSGGFQGKERAGKAEIEMRDLDDPKQRLVEEWSNPRLGFLIEMIHLWCLRLRACANAHCKHVENHILVFNVG